MDVRYNEAEGLPLRQERAAVRKGAKLLDRLLPGWYKQVNLEKLNMSSGSLCMMGQLFGNGVEAKLARKMYPKEMKEAGSGCGYQKTLGDYSHWENTDSGESLIVRLMRKLGVRAQTQLDALDHVCMGHDNRCLWAEAVAERRAGDGKR